MCGRFTLSTNLATLRKLFQAGPASIDIHPRYNIAPAQTILTVIGNGPHRFLEAEWGIPPFWKSSGRIINARIETLHENPYSEGRSNKTGVLSRRMAFLNGNRRKTKNSRGIFTWKTETHLPLPVSCCIWSEGEKTLLPQSSSPPRQPGLQGMFITACRWS